MVKIEVIGCDVCRKSPALTYTIGASDGREVSKDLCREHALVVEDLLEEVSEISEPAPEPEPVAVVEVPAPAPVKKAAPAKKVAALAKRAATPTKKATRRRPKIVSLEEIEALKKS
ncbi:hypothetical protein ACWD4L_42665 [Streptomyces sp. NPDC002596]|uniref:hypothetical protein n=1 Tax=unclassified Streptomyces TaxID=2593676 RepID=UPI003688322A